MDCRVPIGWRPDGPAGWRADRGGYTWPAAATGQGFRVEPYEDGWVARLPVPAPSVLADEARAELGLGDEELAAFEVANAEAYTRVARGSPPTLPRATLRAVWRWNRARAAYTDRLGAVESLACSAPRVELLRATTGAILTAVVWPDLLPIALPDVDLVLLGDGRAAPRIALGPWLDRYPRRGGDHEFGRNGVVHACGLAHRLIDDPPVDELEDALRGVATERALVWVAPATVLDLEGLRAARRELGMASLPPPAGPEPIPPVGFR